MGSSRTCWEPISWAYWETFQLPEPSASSSRTWKTDPDLEFSSRFPVCVSGNNSVSSCLGLEVLEVSGSPAALHCAPVQNRALLGRLLGSGGSSRRPDGAVEKASHLKHFVDRLPETVEVIVDQTWTGSRTRVTSCWAFKVPQFSTENNKIFYPTEDGKLEKHREEGEEDKRKD